MLYRIFIQFLGLAFDSWDLDYYTELFKNKLNRNPTSVECFDLAQSNSEHSRHWFFKVCRFTPEILNIMMVFWDKFMLMFYFVGGNDC